MESSEAIFNGLKDIGIDFIVSVPCVNLSNLLNMIDEDDEIIGYKYINVGVMLDLIKDGVDPMEAIEKATGQYGRFDDAVKKIDPRSE